MVALSCVSQYTLLLNKVHVHESAMFLGLITHQLDCQLDRKIYPIIIHEIISSFLLLTSSVKLPNMCQIIFL